MFRDRICRQHDRPSDNRCHTGARGESLAVKALKKKGYKILEKNYRSKLGEIDVIARDGGVLAFVEVKARRTDRFPMRHARNAGCNVFTRVATEPQEPVEIPQDHNDAGGVHDTVFMSMVSDVPDDIPGF